MARSRALAWAALAGQVIFVAAWLIAGALEPGYSHIEQYVSELGADGAENPGIVNAGIFVLGLSFVALAFALRPVLPRRGASDVAVAALVLMGLGFVASALLPLDCLRSADLGCQARWDAGEGSWQQAGHGWAALVIRAASLVVAFALALALWPRPVALLAFVSGAIGLAIGVMLTAVASAPEDVAEGLWQRLSFASLHLGVLIVAVGVLWAARREPAAPPSSAMRPRDFFAGSWTGEGQIVARPEWLGRRLPVRFRVARDARWISDDAWVFDDTATFGNGYEQRRRVFCEFVTPERVDVVAGHLPEGTTVDFEPEGYRIHPYRLAIPLGPVLFPVWCRDRHRADGEGRLRETVDVMFAGVRIGRVEIRARRDDVG